MKSIFVSIASYRDPECQWTVQNLFQNAHHPERVSVGICWQFISPDDDKFFVMTTYPQQVRCVGYDARQSLGPCWAKSEAQKLWRGEDYLLIIDSHMRFARGWDVKMIDMLNSCPSWKPILSTYPSVYEPPNHLIEGTPQLIPREFEADNELLVFGSVYQKMNQPLRGVLLAGGFIFCSSRFLHEVRYDPQLYFTGEEIALSIRAWTWGWDAFTPHQCLIYHQSDRRGVARHWDDNPDWWQRHLFATERVKHLLGIKFSPRPEVRFGIGMLEPYGLGPIRNIAEFERFVGVSMKERKISKRARQGEFG